MTVRHNLGPQSAGWAKEVEDTLAQLKRDSVRLTACVNAVTSSATSTTAQTGDNSDDIANLDETAAQLQSALDDLNNTQLPALQAELDTLNNTTIPDLNTDLATLDGKFPITTTDISDGAISTAKLAANSVDASKIVANSIGAGQIAANSIGAGQIVANSIGAGQISASYVYAGTITANQINGGTLAGVTVVSTGSDTITLTNGTITFGSGGYLIDGGSGVIAVEAPLVVAGNISNTGTGRTIYTTTLSASSVSTSSLTATGFTAGSTLTISGTMTSGSVSCGSYNFGGASATFGGQIINTTAYTNTNTSAPNMFVGSAGYFQRGTGSSRTLKYNIEPAEVTEELDALYNSVGTFTYHYYDAEPDGRLCHGLVVENMMDSGLRRYVDFDEDDQPMQPNWNQWVSLLTEAVKNLNKRLTIQEEK